MTGIVDEQVMSSALHEGGVIYTFLKFRMDVWFVKTNELRDIGKFSNFSTRLSSEGIHTV